MRASVLSLGFCWVLACAQDARPRAWQPGLPDDGVVAVSQIGQGKVTRPLFNDCWAAFRAQYYVDLNGAFTPHGITLASLRMAANSEYEAFRSLVEHGSCDSTRVRRLSIVGNRDAAGRPVDGYYLVVRTEQPSPEAQIVDRRFAPAPANAPAGMRFYVADPTQVRAETFDVLCDRVSIPTSVAPNNRYEDGYREVAPMPDTKELQNAFVASLKAGSVFKVVILRHTVCPYHTQSTWTPGECRICKGRGGAEFPHLMTLRW